MIAHWNSIDWHHGLMILGVMVGDTAKAIGDIPIRAWGIVGGALAVVLIPSIAAAYIVSAAITNHNNAEKEIRRDIENLKQDIIQRLHHRDEKNNLWKQKLDFVYGEITKGERFTADQGKDHENRLDAIEIECAKNQGRYVSINQNIEHITKFMAMLQAQQTTILEKISNGK